MDEDQIEEGEEKIDDDEEDFSGATYLEGTNFER